MKKPSSESHVSNNNLGIIVEAKNEYTQQLCNVVRPVVYEGLLTMYNNAVNMSESTNDILYHFQSELTKVPNWNNIMIKQETDRVLDSCSYFNELITAVFLSNVKILSSVKLGSTNKKFQLVIPSNENFVHHVYIKVCKKVFDNPYLFSLKKYNNNITNNMSDTFDVIDYCVAHSVRDMLPIKNILESYICKDNGVSDDDSDLSDESDVEDVMEEYVPTMPPTTPPIEDRTSLDSTNTMDEPEQEARDTDALLEEIDEGHDNNTLMGNLFEKPSVHEEEELTKEISLGDNKRTASSETDSPHASPASEPKDESPTFFDDV